jgi:hypothetical protein
VNAREITMTDLSIKTDAQAQAATDGFNWSSMRSS